MNIKQNICAFLDEDKNGEISIKDITERFTQILFFIVMFSFITCVIGFGWIDINRPLWDFYAHEKASPYEIIITGLTVEFSVIVIIVTLWKLCYLYSLISNKVLYTCPHKR